MQSYNERGLGWREMNSGNPSSAAYVPPPTFGERVRQRAITDVHRLKEYAKHNLPGIALVGIGFAFLLNYGLNHCTTAIK